MAGAALACPSPARADDAAPAGDAEQKAAAQALFDRGRALVEQGDFAHACPKLAESQRLDPGIGTLLWLADCYESSGRTASAWATFKEAAGAAAARHDEREHVARERADQLETRLARLDVVVPPNTEAPGLEVRRDGAIIGSAEWGVPVPVDPGPHVITAIAPGRQPWSATIDLPADQGTLPVSIPSLTPLENHDEASHAHRRALPGTAIDRRRGAAGAGQRIGGLVVGGVGLAGLVAGTILSFDAKSTYDGAQSSGHCKPDNECDATGKSERKDAYALATAATIALSAGAVAVAGGAILFFTAPHHAGPSIALLPSRRGCSARVEWAW